jgi:hypothetical protein
MEGSGVSFAIRKEITPENHAAWRRIDGQFLLLTKSTRVISISTTSALEQPRVVQREQVAEDD